MPTKWVRVYVTTPRDNIGHIYHAKEITLTQESIVCEKMQNGKQSNTPCQVRLLGRFSLLLIAFVDLSGIEEGRFDSVQNSEHTMEDD